ncbi:hypothetical protein HF863_10650 [Lactobacillus agilis]|uniref:Uncharacterized protein n=1 Tax=Ligilactobacillus agilis TaxID=1601 RepID=A0A848CC51_9LACO|nr:hypothetical protein [Ligilactobacillus agilis]NME43209.1 hypothetical protein [Ligilactobacillus agilis]
MSIRDKYSLEIGEFNNLLADLRNGKIYEIEKVPGYPSASSLANKLEEQFNTIITKIEKNEVGNLERIFDEK